MYTTPDQAHRVGRMLAGLLASENKRAQLKLTVDIAKANGAQYHQAFRVKAWDSTRDGARMLTLDLGDGDYQAGTWATKVAHVNTLTGELRPARGMQDQALLYAATAAMQYAFTGVGPQPGNGTVVVTEAATCGCCGLQLTHPVSIDLGIGPECAKRMGLDHHYKGTALTSRAKAKQRKADKKQAAAPEAAPAVAGFAPHHIVQSALAELLEANEDELAKVAATTRTAYAGYARAQLEQGAPVLPLALWLAQWAGPAAVTATTCEHGHDAIDAYVACWDCYNGLRTKMDNDLYAMQLAHNAAANAGNYGHAEQLGDQMDTLRGMRSKLVAEWDLNNSPQAWEYRVQHHPAAQHLGHTDQLLVAHWCYTNHASVEDTLAAMDMAATAA